MATAPLILTARARGDRGDGVLAPLVAKTLTLLLLVLVVEFFVKHYARAVIQHQLATAVRAAAVENGGGAVCQRKADQLRSEFLAGPITRGITTRCTESPDRIVATASGQFERWLPVSLPWNIQLSASAVRQDGGAR